MTITPPVQPHGARRTAWGLFRLFAAALLAVAIVAQFMSSFSVALERGQHLPTVITNFFSFFTILSNCLSVFVLLVGGIWLLTAGKRRMWEPRALSVAFTSVGTYMVVTGIVYNVLLRGIPLPVGAEVPWTNEVLHVVGPAILLLELVLRVARKPLAWRTLWIVVAFPIAWIIYTLARGEFITSPLTGSPWWYPYPFLNPYVVTNGYIGVAGYVIGIAAAILAIGALAIWWTRRRDYVPTADDAPRERKKRTREPKVVELAPAPVATDETAPAPVPAEAVTVDEVPSAAELVVENAEPGVEGEPAATADQVVEIEPEASAVEDDGGAAETVEPALEVEEPAVVDVEAEAAAAEAPDAALSSEAEPEPETTPETSIDEAPAATEATVETMVEAETLDANGETEAEAEPEPQADGEPDAQAEPEAQADGETDAPAEPEAQADVEADAQAAPEPQADVEAEAEPDPVASSEPAETAEAGVEDVADVDALFADLDAQETGGTEPTAAIEGEDAVAPAPKPKAKKKKPSKRGPKASS